MKALVVTLISVLASSSFASLAHIYDCGSLKMQGQTQVGKNTYSVEIANGEIGKSVFLTTTIPGSQTAPKTERLLNNANMYSQAKGDLDVVISERSDGFVNVQIVKSTNPNIRAQCALKVSGQ